MRKQAWSNGSAIDLTHREFSLLRYLAERADSIVHRDGLLHELWHFPESSHTRAVDHAIVRLRPEDRAGPAPSAVHYDGARRRLSVDVR